MRQIVGYNMGHPIWSDNRPGYGRVGNAGESQGGPIDTAFAITKGGRVGENGKGNGWKKIYGYKKRS